MKTIMQRNHSLDVLKAICAFLIVFRHSPAPYVTSFHPVTGCAVSCFFMISGYCLYGEQLQEKVGKAIRRMFKILCWSTLLYLPLSLLYARQINDYSAFSVPALENFLLYGTHPFACHLWYIAAYLYVLMFLWVYIKLGWGIKYLFYSVPFFIISYFVVCRHLLTAFTTINIDIIPSWSYLGLPCVLMGMWHKKYCTRDHFSLSKSQMLFLLIGCTCFCFVENYNGLAHDNSLMSTCLALLLLILVSKINSNQNVLSIIGEKYSLYIYIFHIWILYIVGAMVGRSGIACLNEIYLFMSPILIYAITAGVIKLNTLWLK